MSILATYEAFLLAKSKHKIIFDVIHNKLNQSAEKSQKKTVLELALIKTIEDR